ncbi:polysaccharide lyase 8 family protein [Nonomuraea sp. NPDC050556]|uniref:polysaccharide lyase 8 family protein n=1 Tax=Nonomuraea sp. NPDC050556 TaxID=3364369 RepID=UPI0037B47280
MPYRDAMVPTGRSLWPDLPFPSLTATPERLLVMARAHAMTGDPTMAAAVHRGLDHYTRLVYTPVAEEEGNWWDWQIGAPKRLLDAAVLTGYQGRTLLDAVDRFVPESRLGDYSGTSTGANRVDLCTVMLLRAILGADHDRAALASSALAPAMAYVTEGDGLYRDGSFIQHSHVPYQGGYGTVWLAGLAVLFAVLDGSPWAVPDKQVVFDSVEWAFAPFVHEGRCMDLVRGRAITRAPHGDLRTGRQLAAAITLLAQTASPTERSRWLHLVATWHQPTKPLGQRPDDPLGQGPDDLLGRGSDAPLGQRPGKPLGLADPLGQGSGGPLGQWPDEGWVQPSVGSGWEEEWQRPVMGGVRPIGSMVDGVERRVARERLVGSAVDGWQQTGEQQRGEELRREGPRGERRRGEGRWGEGRRGEGGWGEELRGEGRRGEGRRGEGELGEGRVGVVEGVGHRLFSVSARAVHRREGWCAALSMASARVGHYEHGNGENLRGWHTGAGMLYWWADGHGDHYSDFWGTVDPYRLPGTTVSRKVLPDGAGEAWGDTCPPGRWVGGATDGHYATVGQHLNGLESTLDAFKSWFFLDDAVVCMGAGITCRDGAVVETVVDNRRTTAELTVEAGWAHLEGHGGYVMPCAALRTGGERGHTMLWLDHGADPDGGGYFYQLLPGASRAQTEARADRPEWVQVLANSSRQQGIHVPELGVTAVNFWQPGTAGPVTADAPCAVLIVERSGTTVVSVADPRGDLDALTVTIAGRTLTFDTLPASITL